MTPLEMRALGYVLNTSGCATLGHFVDDHEPIGDELWSGLLSLGFVAEIEGHLFVTMDGMDAIDREAGA